MKPRVEASPLYTPEEIARAAGVVPAIVRAAIGDSARRWDKLVGEAEAVQLVVDLTPTMPPRMPPRMPPDETHGPTRDGLVTPEPCPPPSEALRRDLDEARRTESGRRWIAPSSHIPDVLGRRALRFRRRDPDFRCRTSEPGHLPPPLGDSAPARAARSLFSDAAHTSRTPVMPAAASGVVHGLILAVVLVVTGAGFDATVVTATNGQLEPLHLVYLVQPGPGGGGGGGGLKNIRPAPRAERAGPARVSSPIPPPAALPVPAPARPPEPTVLPSEQLPAIMAPVVSLPGDQQGRAGMLDAARADADSHGSGSGGGAGSGNGTGMGEGDGPGLGPGSGGGTGGGPYRPGSGVEPPVVLREVRPTYTEEARARAVTGEVVLEVLVRRDGTVGSTRVLSGLGWGLDERAVEAIRQWRFGPARRLGTPVDVLVEIVVEFRLR